MKIDGASAVAALFALPRMLAELGWGQMEVDFKTAELISDKKRYLHYRMNRCAEAMAWREELKTNKKATVRSPRIHP